MAQELVTLWDTYELADLLRDDRVLPPDDFWLSMFTTPFFSEKKTIVFNELPIWDRRLAPFVMPHLQGHVMREPKGPGIREFEPAYLKPKHVLEPSQTVNRLPSEPLGGNLSRQERFNRLTAQRLQSQASMIKRRWDWMAAQAAIYGYVDVAGELYAPVRVNFGRDASLTTVLSGAALWSDDASDPLDDLAEARDTAFAFGKSPVNKLVFGQLAWKAFRAKPAVKDLMDIRYRLPGNAQINISGFGTGQPAQLNGTYQLPDGGTVEFWTYSNSYVDPVDGQTKQVLDTRDVVGIGAAMQGVRAFGAIEDFAAGLVATDMFAKQWMQDDPSVAAMTTQSAPLMVPVNANNSFRMRVLA